MTDIENGTNGKLQIISLGGSGDIGKNMLAFRYEDTILVVDCGVSFANEEQPGVDLIIPDITYLLEHREMVKAICLTHGHEDHIGALPFVLKQLPLPLYGTQLTLGMVREKLSEHGLVGQHQFQRLPGGQARGVRAAVRRGGPCHAQPAGRGQPGDYVAGGNGRAYIRLQDRQDAHRQPPVRCQPLRADRRRGRKTADFRQRERGAQRLVALGAQPGSRFRPLHARQSGPGDRGDVRLQPAPRSDGCRYGHAVRAQGGDLRAQHDAEHRDGARAGHSAHRGHISLSKWRTSASTIPSRSRF